MRGDIRQITSRASFKKKLNLKKYFEPLQVPVRQFYYRSMARPIDISNFN